MANYQLAISNIAWHKEDDEAVYTAMQQAGFTGLEIAPTRIFPEMPYENLTSALLFGGYLKNQWGIPVCPQPELPVAGVRLPQKPHARPG